MRLEELYPDPGTPRRIAVAAAEERDVLLALNGARQYVEPILVGDASRIQEIAAAESISLDGVNVVDIPDPATAAAEAVRLVSSGDADLLMKGLVDTSILLKAVLNEEWGLRTGRVLSHVALFEVPGHDRILTVTDAAMNIAPDLDQKAEILMNSVSFLRDLGYDEPNVAVLAAKEKVNPKMIATVDAAALTERNRNGEITGCRVAGPLALDNAVSRESAAVKGIDDPVAGRADVLLVPDIEAGNILYKALAFLTPARNAGVIVGARAPVVLTSRADSAETKRHSIAIAARAVSR